MANLSIFDQTKNILPVYWTYCGLGLFAFFANFIIIFVYLSSASLRSKFALFIGLALAEGINGAAFFITGMERLITEYSLQDVYTFPKVTRFDCASQSGNTFLILGSQGPALISLALGIERFCAIKFPTSYRQFKERTFNYLFTSFGHVAGFVFNFIAFWVIQKYRKDARNKIFSKEFDQIR
uniref:Uncharacterized protein n=1 Tax=Panagrolaimus sp. ES5 TaxID=591445 RepID=A0AC34G5X2_9BILA